MMEIKNNCSYRDSSKDIWLSQILLERSSLGDTKNNSAKKNLNSAKKIFFDLRARVKKTTEYVMGGNIREVLLTIAVLFFSVMNVSAGELDILTEKLVEKNILSHIEAQIMLDETRQAVAGEITAGMSYAVPKWAQMMKFKGDLRLRYQYNNKNGSVNRQRGRYRLRFGAESRINNSLKVFFGLASGGNDPRSTNQTMDASFETPDIRLDYAFSQYAIKPWLTVYGGKFQRKLAFCQLSDFLWDSDINPEGISLTSNKVMRYDFDLFLNSGWFVLDESNSDTSNPSMSVIQPGFQWDMNDERKLKFAVAYYGFNDLKGDSLSHSRLTNSLSGGKLSYDYGVFNPSIEFSFEDFENTVIPYYAVFAEHVRNEKVSKNNKGNVFGFAIGNKKVEKQSQWQLKYARRRLEKDAWLDTFPDSDFYGGKTGVKGHELILEYALVDNVIFGADYYNTQNISGIKKTEDLCQMDLKLKF